MPSVLVVDDDPDIRSVIAFKLERAGYTVYEEADGEAGLAAATEERPDLVALALARAATDGRGRP